MQIEFKIPDIGMTDAVNVADVMVKVGDTVEVDQSVITLETDKASMEVPIDVAGKITEIKIKVGDKVRHGDVVIIVEAEGSSKLATPVASVVEAATSAVLTELVPDLSGNNDVSVIEVSVKVGDVIEKDQTLITLETDKATMEVPSSYAGVVESLKIKVGDKVNFGDIILTVKTTQVPVVAIATPEQISTTVSVNTVPATVNKADSTPAADVVIDEEAFRKAFATPSIRKLARELGVNLGKVTGTGDKQRITEQDVKSHVKAVMTGSSGGSLGGLELLAWPEVDFAKFGDVTVTELSRIKKISGANLARNWVMIPHVTQFDEADITSLEEFRKSLNDEYKKENVKITPLAFMIKACVFALKQFPEINASINKDNLILKNYYNIGFAADTPNGLVVPVLKDADKKGIVEIAKETVALAALAREGKLKPADMQGGTFTISSLGGIGGTAFTPIINAPEVAILGVSKSSIKPYWNGEAFEPRLMLPLSFSYDHRIIDGAMAARFTSYLSKILSDVRRLAL